MTYRINKCEMHMEIDIHWHLCYNDKVHFSNISLSVNLLSSAATHKPILIITIHVLHFTTIFAMSVIWLRFFHDCILLLSGQIKYHFIVIKHGYNMQLNLLD